ncbi:MerR family transcriptional regulator [Streptomyces sp. NPDC059011]|uniref:MerR family transcriptional regulator n=1 Tax=unclassified Streptomyces TaxID=2593676 RepID=UPI0036C936F2
MPDTTEVDGLTVGQVSTLIGVTVRALHHWDGIGLLRPSLRTAAGYRLYTAGDLERLHRIVVYRGTGLGLDRIQAVLDDSTADVPGALRTQRIKVAERIDRLEQFSAGLDRMIDAHDGGLPLTVEQKAAIFGPEWNPDWPAQARRRFGDTTQWRQYAERSASRDPDEWQAITDAMADFESAFGDAMDAAARLTLRILVLADPPPGATARPLYHHHTEQPQERQQLNRTPPASDPLGGRLEAVATS